MGKIYKKNKLESEDYITTQHFEIAQQYLKIHVIYLWVLRPNQKITFRWLEYEILYSKESKAD